MRNFVLIFWLIALVACNPSGIENPNPGVPITGFDNMWLIPFDEIVDGGPGKDGIPSIDNPVFIDANLVDFLDPEDLVAAVKVGQEIRVYPIKILNWHEIVNDEYEDLRFAVTFCPLTGSSIAWNSIIGGQHTEFGISGLLYNNNLIAYDRRTNSHWSQMKMIGVNGKHIETEVEPITLIETKWETISNLENVKVLSTVTGFNRNYFVNPYGNYPTNNQYIIFPNPSTDKRFEEKERVLNIFVADGIKSYAVSKFENPDTKIIQENISGTSLVIIGSAKHNFATAFINDSGSDFSVVNDESSAIMQDNLGNQYDIFGSVLSGPDAGGALVQVKSYISYWFAISSFYDRITIY